MSQTTDERGLLAAQRALAALATKPIYDEGAAGVDPDAPLPKRIDATVFLTWSLGAPWGSPGRRFDPSAAWSGGPAAYKRAGAPLFRPVLQRAQLRVGDVIVIPPAPHAPAVAALVTAASVGGLGQAVACGALYQRLYGSALAFVEVESLEAKPLARLMRPNYAALEALFELQAA